MNGDWSAGEHGSEGTDMQGGRAQGPLVCWMTGFMGHRPALELGSEASSLLGTGFRGDWSAVEYGSGVSSLIGDRVQWPQVCWET